MTITQVWGALLVFILCPLMGGLPLTGWITQWVSGQQLASLGTGNISVSAAFYHGGKGAGILAVLSEAAKGIGAVLLARQFFPSDPVWEVIALIALVMGRYWFAKGAGTTNVTWGFVVHAPIVAGLTFVISFLFFTVVRERKSGRLLVLILLPILTALRHSNGIWTLAVAALSGLIAWIYQKIPDDLELEAGEGRLESQRMFQFFRGDRALLSLDQSLDPAQVGGKAATLARLRQQGYPVPRGYVLPAGDDPAPLLAVTQPSAQEPVAVRSSAVGEDGAAASAAGQYLSILNVTTQAALATAINRCYGSYNGPAAVAYRRDRGLPEANMAVIVQQQVQAVCAGVAFSRDPVSRAGDAVIIEALPGGAQQVVSGQVTPQRYRVLVQSDDIPVFDYGEASETWQLPAALTLTVERLDQGEPEAGNWLIPTLPLRLIQQVAFLARHLETRAYGVPQDIEWAFDGEQIWLLQSRPITTLTPIWTRKIAAEVIPGAIRPLTWSINRPLTCGVWGDIFGIVLGDRVEDLDFNRMATLHHSHAYFNASLLGETFLRMGLPPESLEFLTRGAKFSKPPLSATLRNLPGLLRLAMRELFVGNAFAKDDKVRFTPALERLAKAPAATLDEESLLDRIDRILESLTLATYYNILVPLSFALRKAMFKVADPLLDSRRNPEVAALEDLRAIAQDSRPVLGSLDSLPDGCSSLFAALAENPDGQAVLDRLNQFLTRYGYLSQVGTDIAVPTWAEKPRPVRELFAQFLLKPPKATAGEDSATVRSRQSGKVRRVQQRLDLKGRVNEVYSRLLAELRWSFVALEQRWLQAGVLDAPGDLFFLDFDDIRQVLESDNPTASSHLSALPAKIAARKARFEADQGRSPIPTLAYGTAPPQLDSLAPVSAAQTLRGIGGSPGQIEGTIQVVTELQTLPGELDGKILVVPYTDAGWSPLLARAGGLVAEVGGQLSHGAIVAREYGIPAVMNIADATRILQNGDRVRIDGEQGIVERLRPAAVEE
ncbi:MAG: glycerol-3-phosphate acyltransferase [Cyanobacteria bacterium P01_C01_bin.73]